MATEDQTENTNNLTTRNQTHTPTPSNPDVNVEASLITSSQLFTTSASLLDCVDSIWPFIPLLIVRENACCVTRWKEDHWRIKIVRSIWYSTPEIWLRPANLVLQDAIERIFVGDIYGDIAAGIYVVRGENVVLLGEIVRQENSKRLTIGSG